MTWLSDVVYKLNRTGPRTNPSGTPNGRCGHNKVPDMLMLWYLSEKYNLNEELGQKCQNVYEGIVKGLNDSVSGHPWCQ